MEIYSAREKSGVISVQHAENQSPKKQKYSLHSKTVRRFNELRILQNISKTDIFRRVGEIPRLDIHTDKTRYTISETQ